LHTLRDVLAARYSIVKLGLDCSDGLDVWMVVESPLMRDEKQPLGGAVVVTADSASSGRLDVEVLWAHTTDSMCLGYMSTADQQAKVSPGSLFSYGVFTPPT